MLREVFLSELAGLGCMLLLASTVASLGLFGPAYFFAVVSVFVVPMIWLSYRLTPGFRAALRLLRIKDSSWSPSEIFAFCGAGLFLLSVGMALLILVGDEGGSLTDTVSSGELDSLPKVLMGFFVAVVLAPIGEEWVFRGFFYGGLRHKIGPFQAALFSSLCFAALHGYSWLGLVAVFIYGLVFCWLYQRSQSLIPGILVHAIYNCVVTAEMVGWLSLH